MPPWILHFDGLFEPRYKPYGIATYGFVLRHGAAKVHEGHGLVAGPGEGGSANVAEFGALLAGLLTLKDLDLGECPVEVRGDNRLAVETVAGRWKLSSEVLLPFRDRAQEIVRELGGVLPAPDGRQATLDARGKVTLTKVSREENAEADALSRLAYHEYKVAHPGWLKSAGDAGPGRRPRER